MKKRIDVDGLTPVVGTLYPPPFDLPCRGRERSKLGDAAGLSQFGVNLCRLPPGAWSSQRHWHTGGDEFVYVLSGEVVLVTDGGEEVLRAGMPPGSRRKTRTVIASRTARTMTHRYSRSGPAFLATRPIIRISTWSRRRGENQPPTRIGTEHPIRTSSAADLDRIASCDDKVRVVDHWDRSA